ncbi:MAG: phosphoribosylanthranilate isomerase [Alicyclobacillaceae bacterium]|nr:phosphoribosylanthranilate isomerase [Alicyclobacillaceae bacterium]
MTVIKACGFTREEDVVAAEETGIDWLGFVFAESKRRVSPDKAAQLRSLTTKRCMGVFVDFSPDQVLKAAEVARLDGVQLHGGEAPEDCDRLRREGLFVVKVFSAIEDTPEQVARYRGAVDAVLLDAGVSGAKGGRGQTFEWRHIPEWRSQAEGIFLWVAGGLHSGNVEQLLREYRPDGVDVSSGIEAGCPGVKDRSKMEEFVRKVREWDGTTR